MYIHVIAGRMYHSFSDVGPTSTNCLHFLQSIIDSLKDMVGAGPLPVTYHQVHFVNGTVCEANKKPRTTEVLVGCLSNKTRHMYVNIVSYCLHVWNVDVHALKLFIKV